MSKHSLKFDSRCCLAAALVSVAFRTILVLACLGTPLTMRLQGQNIPQVIDGARNPEMIPDWRAYSVLFRFISNRTGEEREAILAYLHTIGLGGENCETCGVSPTQQNAQIDALIATAENFSKSAADLHASMKEALKRNPDLSPGSESPWKDSVYRQSLFLALG